MLWEALLGIAALYAVGYMLRGLAAYHYARAREIEAKARLLLIQYIHRDRETCSN